MCNNPNPDLVKTNVYCKTDQIPSIHSQDFERKQNSENNQGSNLDLVNITLIHSQAVERKLNSDNNQGA